MGLKKKLLHCAENDNALGYSDLTPHRFSIYFVSIVLGAF